MKFHCMNSVELILLKCIPRGHPNPCYRVGISCSIFKNTSATCAYPLVSNARKLKRDKRAHACAQVVCKIPLLARRTRPKGYAAGRPSAARDDRVSCIQARKAPSRTRHVREGALRKIYEKVYIFFVRPLLVYRTLPPSVIVRHHDSTPLNKK